MRRPAVLLCSLISASYFTYLALPAAMPPMQGSNVGIVGVFPVTEKNLPTSGRALTTTERDTLVYSAAQDAKAYLSTSSYDSAVQRLEDDNGNDQVSIETHNVTLNKYPGVAKSGGSNSSADRVVFHADVAAGIAPGTTLAGLIAFRGALLDGLGECDAYKSVLEYTVAKLASVTSGSLLESDLVAQIYEAKQKLEERPENKDSSSGNDCTFSFPSGFLTNYDDASYLREGSDSLPAGVPAGDLPIPSQYITYFSEKRSNSVGGSYDPVVYTAFTTCKSLQVLYRVGSGSKVGRRVLGLRMYPLAIALDDSDRDNPVVYVAGVKLTGESIMRKVTFIDGPANEYADFSVVTMSNPNFGYVADMIYDHAASNLYILDDSNDRISIYNTASPPTGSLPVFTDSSAYSDLASMKTLLRDSSVSPALFYVLVNAPYQLTCGDASPIGVVWDANSDGVVEHGEFDVVANVVQ